jgi:membrane associated rhomboid family serine protease
MTKVVKTLAIINIIAFTISYIFSTDIFHNLFMLFPVGNENYATYQWITHQFMHASILHIFFNMLALLSFGPTVENHFKKSFIWFYLISGIGAALLQFIFVSNTILLGASGSIFGVILVYIFLEPNSKVFLFFILPIKGKFVLPIILLFEAYMSFFHQSDGVAHLAHLGGALTGFLYFFLSKTSKKKLINIFNNGR